jgi:hypothetical protein
MALSLVVCWLARNSCGGWEAWETQLHTPRQLGKTVSSIDQTNASKISLQRNRRDGALIRNHGLYRVG